MFFLVKTNIFITVCQFYNTTESPLQKQNGQKNCLRPNIFVWILLKSSLCSKVVYASDESSVLGTITDNQQQDRHPQFGLNEHNGADPGGRAF
jgi:hypothetical protein